MRNEQLSSSNISQIENNSFINLNNVHPQSLSEAQN
jgi:hypothetical protein